MALVTNRGKLVILRAAISNLDTTGAVKGDWELHLCTSGTVPTIDLKVIADMSEIATGNTYTTSGYALARSASAEASDPTEDDTNDWAILILPDFQISASGGPLPSDSVGFKYAVLTDTTINKNIVATWDIGSEVTVSDGDVYTISGLSLKIELP